MKTVTLTTPRHAIKEGDARSLTMCNPPYPLQTLHELISGRSVGMYTSSLRNIV